MSTPQQPRSPEYAAAVKEAWQRVLGGAIAGLLVGLAWVAASLFKEALR